MDGVPQVIFRFPLLPNTNSKWNSKQKDLSFQYPLFSDFFLTTAFDKADRFNNYLPMGVGVRTSRRWGKLELFYEL